MSHGKILMQSVHLRFCVMKLAAAQMAIFEQ